MVVEEFNFTDRDFYSVSRLIGERTGIVLTEAKKQMVYSRLVRRLRLLGISEFSSYLDVVKNKESGELMNFVNAMTTNLTAFFREPHHFEYLANKALPRAMALNQVSRKLRIWSAGCSTGEEAYTIASVVREVIPPSSGWDVKILATDLDSNVLDTARRGVYPYQSVAAITPERLKQCFLKGQGRNEGKVLVRRELRDLISFRQLNLIEPWALNGPFDLVFCRNVVIYFNKETQSKLVNRYAALMPQNSELFLGHSESLYKVSERFELIGNTIYRKVD